MHYNGSFVNTLSFLIFFSGCQLIKSTANKVEALTQCTFELADVHKKVSFIENTRNIWNYVIEADINAINPTSETITLGSYELDLYANNKYLSNIATQTPIVLNSNATTTITIKTVISPIGVLRVFLKKLFNKPVEYKINGIFVLQLREFSIPIKCQLVKFVDEPREK